KPGVGFLIIDRPPVRNRAAKDPDRLTAQEGGIRRPGDAEAIGPMGRPPGVDLIKRYPKSSGQVYVSEARVRRIELAGLNTKVIGIDVIERPAPGGTQTYLNNCKEQAGSEHQENDVKEDAFL